MKALKTTLAALLLSFASVATAQVAGVITLPTPEGEWGVAQAFKVTNPDGSISVCVVGEYMPALKREDVHLLCAHNVVMDDSMVGKPDGALIDIPEVE